METVNPRTIFLVTTDIKTCKLIGMNRESMKETLETFKIGAQVMARRSNTNVGHLTGHRGHSGESGGEHTLN